MRILFITDLQGVSGATAQSQVLARAFSSRKDVEFILCNTPPSNIRYHKPSVSTEIEGVRSVYPTRSMYDAVKEEKPDIVITNVFDLNLASEAPKIAKEYIFVPRVGINLIELMMSGRFQSTIPHVSKFLLSADNLIACSESSKKTLESIGCKNVWVIPTGIDPGQFKLSKCRDPTIGIMGRVVPIKNHITLLQAFRQLQKSVPDSELAIVGAGNLVSVYNELVGTLGVEGKVAFYGYVKDISIIFAEISVFALPSFSENLPQAILEAYACGVPCVVSESGWGDSFQACLKARPDCPWEWAEKLRILLTDEEVWRKVRVSQLKELKEKFSVERVVDQYVGLFNELREKRRRVISEAVGKPPKVSVIVPVKNRKRRIKKCLGSILAEGYPNLEVLVIDGESTDGTVKVVEEYSKKHPEVRCVSEADKNQSEAKNKGLKMATGDYVTFLDSDDEMIPGKLKTLATFLRTHDDHFGVFGNTISRQVNGEIIENYRVTMPKDVNFRTLSVRNYIGSGSIMLRNSPELVFNEERRFGEDYELWLRLMMKYKIGYVDEDVYYWTSASPDGVGTQTKDWMKRNQELRKEMSNSYSSSPYSRDMRIAIFCDAFGLHPFGGPAIRGYHICEMLCLSRVYFRIFYHPETPPHSSYLRRTEHILPKNKFKAKDFNVFYVMGSYPTIFQLNSRKIQPIIGSNHIPNSAPEWCLPYLSEEELKQRQHQITFEKSFLKLAKGRFWLAQSNFQRNEYTRLGMNLDKTEVYLAPNPTDTALFKPKGPLGNEIIWSGKANWAKNLPLLRRTVKDFPRERFICLSERGLPEIGSNAELITGKTLFAMPSLLQRGKIFISTSVTENQPCAVLEAMSMGLPVLAQDVSGMPEIIEDGKTGLLAPLGDADTYKEKLRWLIEDEKLRRRLGNAARKFVVNNFSYYACLDKYLNLFKIYLEES